MTLTDLLADVRQIKADDLQQLLSAYEADVKTLRTLLVSARRRERSEQPKPKRGRPRRPAPVENGEAVPA